MAALPDELKFRIVQALACYDTPSEAARAIKEQFGLAVTPQQCEAYDPTKRAGANLGKKWRAVFEETRKAFLKGAVEVPISHRMVRLRALGRMARKAEDMGNMTLAAQILEQAAKETGGIYTNRHRHEHTGKEGGPIVTRSAREMTDDELRADIERIEKELAG